jgi:glycosyltransferase involved in cell wall biosynthesis
MAEARTTGATDRHPSNYSSAPGVAAGLKTLRILILANWRDDGRWELAKQLAVGAGKLDLLQPALLESNAWWARRVNRLSAWLAEFVIPVRALFRRRDYDVIVSWTSRLGVTYGILSRLLPAKRPAAHFAVDFHIDLRRSDLVYQIKLVLLRYAAPAMDICFCTSTLEEGVYAQMFGLPRRRFRFLPMDYPDCFSYPECPKKDYVFAYGNSARDFSVLIEAARNVSLPVIILSQSFRPDAQLPTNVTLINQPVPESALFEYITRARAVVLPLLHFDFSVGQRALMEVMSLGCPCIVTRNMATIEYGKDEESVLFFDAGDGAGLTARLQSLIADAALAKRLGRAARAQALQYADRNVQVFLETLAEVAATREIASVH